MAWDDFDSILARVEGRNTVSGRELPSDKPARLPQKGQRKAAKVKSKAQIAARAARDEELRFNRNEWQRRYQPKWNAKNKRKVKAYQKWYRKNVVNERRNALVRLGLTVWGTPRKTKLHRRLPEARAIILKRDLRRF